DDDDDDSPTVESYCAARADGYYDHLQACFGPATYPESSRARLVSNLAAACQNSASGVAAGRIAFDPEAAAACVAAVRAGGCVAGYDPPPCDGVFRGLVPVDGECFWSERGGFLAPSDGCAEGFCPAADRTCPGTCRAWPELGEPCGVGCGPEADCDLETDRCRPLPELGEPCPSGRCAEGSLCLGESRTCRRTVQGADELCDEETLCPPPTFCIEGRCRVDVPLGDPCAIPNNCAEGAVCAPESFGGSPVCRTPPNAGEACFSGLPCAAGLRCSFDPFPEGTCVPLPAAGESCLEGECQEGLWCQVGPEGGDGTCQPRGMVGADCTSLGGIFTAGCREGLFCAEDGRCAAVGGEGDPCNVFEVESCREGFWCRRATGTCSATPGADGDSCNPFDTDSCGAGLTCHCEADDWDRCPEISREPVATDVCRPVLAAGAECFRDQECGIGGFCERTDFDTTTVPGTCLDRDTLVCLP
ncbi:MAG TPA: hypothetical protein RMF84_06825, partial [Polyangiaceae bacterium LLY-WYZ-14_1]|nr:hypothetical protein [Polyangiaceae bacterium LLY-WYZ-14_1]